MLNRETYYTAIASRLQAVPGIKTFGRRVLSMSEVPAAKQPALFLAQTYQTPDYEVGRTTFWNLGAKLYLYVRGPSNKTPSAVMNPLLDAICAQFAPDNPMANACTLGGLVHHCRIGAIETDEGTMGEQAFALIPLDILVAGSPI